MHILNRYLRALCGRKRLRSSQNKCETRYSAISPTNATIFRSSRHGMFTAHTYAEHGICTFSVQLTSTYRITQPCLSCAAHLATCRIRSCGALRLRSVVVGTAIICIASRLIPLLRTSTYMTAFLTNALPARCVRIRSKRGQFDTFVSCVRLCFSYDFLIR